METWRDIVGFEGYQVSDQGRVRSFWKHSHVPSGYGAMWVLSDIPMILSQSDDGNGYSKVCLTNHETGMRYCRKFHRLVAEAFLDGYFPEATVDHITSGPEGKRDNSIRNLRWVTRGDNVRKAYNDGMHDERIRRSRKPLIIQDTWTNEELYFESVQKAALELRVHYTTIIHAINHYPRLLKNRYLPEYADAEERMLHEQYYDAREDRWY